jgi:hypothetical protein
VFLRLSWPSGPSRRTTFELAFALGDSHTKWDAGMRAKVLFATERFSAYGVARK